MAIIGAKLARRRLACHCHELSLVALRMWRIAVSDESKHFLEKLDKLIMYLLDLVPF